MSAWHPVFRWIGVEPEGQWLVGVFPESLCIVANDEPGRVGDLGVVGRQVCEAFLMVRWFFRSTKIPYSCPTI